jgi:Domain of unknown function (DUF5122) beta-propeller
VQFATTRGRAEAFIEAAILKKAGDRELSLRASAVAIQPDGRIVAAGTVLDRDFALARYTSSGKLDGSFGSGGKVRTDLGN